MLQKEPTLAELFPQIEIKLAEPLSRYTYTKTGGKADILAFPKSIAEVQSLVTYAHTAHLPLTVIGNASNLIVKDGGIRGLVLILTSMAVIKVTGTTLYAQAGAKLIDTTIAAANASLTGIEFAAGIPGSVGGAMFMNAGAYGGEMSDAVATVTVLLPDGTVSELSRTALHFAYRHSIIQENHSVVLAATFVLAKGDQATIKAQMADFNARRSAKQPLEYPSCGSVFKRPTGYFTGKLIHEAGLQGHIIGGVQVSTKHAGFMVNLGNGTATDYINLIRHVQTVVFDQFGVALEPEVRIIGEDLIG
ncbi:UDP-N-acetylmuramate dehydrogenase [Loigolactobacillus coryniformis]|uniref:UDP-N-acetylmuramate dehydrogenase n=1 Tax=Loigolactobacillus coryniformis TaxID=1610 RepID=UPI001C605599|nr:UDP-N-acetylmuramate dehydrogenase [Loigolactobacillus coryniformis]MBW4802047.1 UDP-N-acetylmuramate dehydrogenase [Loigolactobacillus coryniformis subsp. torquens]MBW4804760.1 UDP-N-acetylmuramate dehydrogenase [Loigolactobacillus coryniformis subsp. torquens]